METASAFKRKFKAKQIWLDHTNQHRTCLCNEYIYVCTLKLCLQFVRCFGENITELSLLNRSNGYLDQYILKLKL